MARQYPVQLRWRDLDNQGHVYHATFLTLLDEARTAFLADLGIQESGAYVLAQIELAFVEELTCEHGAVTVSFHAPRVGKSSMHLVEEMYSGGQLKARSTAVIVLWDRRAGTSRQLRAAERASLMRHGVANGGPSA